MSEEIDYASFVLAADPSCEACRGMAAGLQRLIADLKAKGIELVPNKACCGEHSQLMLESLETDRPN
jgi:hypothetical protein